MVLIMFSNWMQKSAASSPIGVLPKGVGYDAKYNSFEFRVFMFDPPYEGRFTVALGGRT